jgi:hypothetical protein
MVSTQEPTRSAAGFADRGTEDGKRAIDMRTLRVVMALAVMVALVGVAGQARAAAKTGRQAAGGMEKAADGMPGKGRAKAEGRADAKTEGKTEGKAGAKAPAKSAAREKKETDKPALKAAARGEKETRKKARGDKPVEVGKNTDARKKSA